MQKDEKSELVVFADRLHFREIMRQKKIGVETYLKF